MNEEPQRQQTERVVPKGDDGREGTGGPVCLWNTLCRRKLPGTRRNSSGGWQKRRVKPATSIARRSRPSDRSESGYGKPLRRRGPRPRVRAPQARRLGSRPRTRIKRWWTAVLATADALNATLEQMKVVEEMRRTLRELRAVNKLEPN